jgi:acetyl-CoA carboxylase biotin carboxyl carrier protein
MATKETKFIDKKSIKELVDILNDISISVSKGMTSTTVNSNNVKNESMPVAETKADYRNDPRVLKSPMVGTVYLQPEPGAKKFVNEGDSVSSGQTMLIIEAMKTMNPIESNLQGKITKIFVQNEEAVEFNQPLMLIE